MKDLSAVSSNPPGAGLTGSAVIVASQAVSAAMKAEGIDFGSTHEGYARIFARAALTSVGLFRPSDDRTDDSTSSTGA